MVDNIQYKIDVSSSKNKEATDSDKEYGFNDDELNLGTSMSQDIKVKSSNMI